MGVIGLTKLVKSDDRFLIKNHRLHDVKIVVDANNLARVLLEKVEYQDRTDRVGVNLVAYGKQVELLFDNLKKCGIEPILVFDGAQTNNTKTSKETEHVGNVEELNQLASRNRYPAVLPSNTKMILNSIAPEKQVRFVEYSSKGDEYIEETADDCDNSERSEDSDVFIYDVNSATLKKTERIIEDIKKVAGFNPLTSRYSPPVVHPICTSMILKSIAIEKQVKVVQCFYEGEKYVAKIANDHDSLLLSGDSDFFIFDVKRGVILTESLKFEDIKVQDGEEQSGEKTKSQFYIECELFNQGHFVKAFPGLDKRCLPLFASIVGNDASSRELYFLLLLIPRNSASTKYGRSRMLLEFLRNKSLEQSFVSLLTLIEAKMRQDIMTLIKDSFRYYNLPKEDDFDSGISQHYEEAFCETYSSKFDNDPVKVGAVARREIRLLSQWLKKKMETSNLSKTCLELALRNIVCLRPEMDDFTKPSVCKCINRYRSVLLALMRSSHSDNLPCAFYDRKGDSIKRFEVKPEHDVTRYGPMNNLIFDVCDDLSDDIVTTKLTQRERTGILLGTFVSAPVLFLYRVAQYEEFLQPQHAEEFAVVKVLLRSVELVEGVAFPKHSRESVLVTYLYYLHFGDSEIKVNIADDAAESYLGFLDNLKRLAQENRLEDIDQWNITDYDITIVRNITQMQNAIRAYEELNAFLGTTLPTLRMHKWFNSSFIYNFATIVEKENIQMPSFVDDQ